MQAFLVENTVEDFGLFCYSKEKQRRRTERSLLFSKYLCQRGVTQYVQRQVLPAYPRATDFEKRDEISSRVLALTKAFPLYE